jgi:hypothetical protein
MGEHLGDETFRVANISVQHAGGSEACFIRNPADHHSQLQEFFALTGENYSRFNYLGEWHSHPSFDSRPSITDVVTMQSIVNDPAVGVNFLILLIISLRRRNRIDIAAVAFRPGFDPTSVAVLLEDDAECEPRGKARKLLRRIFRF